MSECVLYETRGPVAWITLNRPDKLNAIDTAMVHALGEALHRAESDDDVKVMVLTGAGDRAFSAGYDIGDEIADQPANALEWRTVLARDIDLTMNIWAASKPTIAAVDGYCLAGACEIAMACDIIVATARSTFGEPEIRYGSGPVTLLMPFVLGQKKTNELLLTGDHLDAAAALDAGLVNRVVEVDQLESEVTGLALRIAPTPLAVLRLTKKALQSAYEAMGLRAAVQSNLEISSVLNAADTPEQLEFDRVAKASGLKAALDWRDQRYAVGTA
jgi:enoyl-CoA hydratase/carnithine racemase